MKILNSYERGTAKALAATALTIALTGCGGFSGGTAGTSTPVVSHGVALHGTAHGGQQPIAGATILFFAAGTGGYGQSTPNLLTTTVLTDGGGNFNITGDYTCSAGQQMFIVASGGNPGAGVNVNSVIMAALGDCANLTAATDISINEVTTIGSAFALAPFMPAGSNASSTSNGIATFALGSSPSNTAGLARAFASVNKLINTVSGSSTGSALPANAVGPSTEINTLANVLASCINSAGGQSHCGQLFGYATPASGTAPADTLQVAINIAQNPTLNTASIYNLTPPAGPFQPQLTAAPADWTMAIKYKNIGLNAPVTATVDASGQVWFANPAANTRVRSEKRFRGRYIWLPETISG